MVFVSENMAAFTIRIREFSQLSPPRQQALHDRGEAYNTALQGILADGRKTGDMDASLDVRLSTLILIGELNSLTQWYNRDGRYSARRLAAHLAGMMVVSVASDSAMLRYGGVTELRKL